MTIITELLTLAKKINNYEIDPVTGLKVLWTSTTAFRVTCPTGKRWFVLGGQVSRNVSATCGISLYDVSGNVIATLAYAAAGTTAIPFPDVDYFQGNCILDVGEYIEASFGLAQDAGSYCSCMILEVDV